MEGIVGEIQSANTSVRASLPSMKAPSKHNNQEKKKPESNCNGTADVAGKSTINRRRSNRERKMELLQDVDKLKRRLKHEENVHRALERAFTRPLGALPRLPPYLPPYALKLLAEVAVLEEEVIWLEHKVVSFRQGLYQQAVYTSSKINDEFPNSSNENSPVRNCNKHRRSKSLSQHEFISLISPTRTQQFLGRSISSRKLFSSGLTVHDRNGHGCIKSVNRKETLPEPRLYQSSRKADKDKNMSGKVVTPVKKFPIKRTDSIKLQVDDRLEDHQAKAQEDISNSSSGDKAVYTEITANEISEELVKCLTRIFLTISSSVDGFLDPYGNYRELRSRETSSYRNLCSINASSIDLTKSTNVSFLINRLKFFLGKLSLVNLDGLAHKQKLAFWINTYNSCIMNAFLEHGVPETPEMVVALMQKATITVGGHLLNAITIEHFILRLPYHLKFNSLENGNSERMRARSAFRLEWSEPLVTFALACGSWSSPSVRVYSADNVEEELEAAKRDYLEAAIGVSNKGKLIIPKVLDWYLFDFAKDLDSLIDWICAQLPNKLREDVVMCAARKNKESLLEFIQVVPYDFSFRLLLQR